MNLPRLCIERPRFALVLAILIIIFGTVSVNTLPIADYPNVAPPVVQVSARYPGADAVTIANTVAAPIEIQVNGVEDMIYMSSASSSQGQYLLQVTFQRGIDPAQAESNVQNRVTQALSKLPEEVQDIGVEITSHSPSLFFAFDLYAENDVYDAVFVSNYATVNIMDRLARIPGVGASELLAPLDYSMRIWLDPVKLEAINLSPQDIVAAVQQQNIEASLGAIGGSLSSPDQVRQYTIIGTGELATPEQFGNVIVRAGDDGAVIRLKDVARVELGAADYSRFSTQLGQPAANVLVYARPDVNAIDLADRIYAELEEITQSLPEGLNSRVLFDSTVFVRASIQEIVKTLIITAAIVVLVVFLFLGTVRATVIPALTIPTSLLGSFIVMSALGVSINTITLFGLVLAVGLVVDDAIIVVENVNRIIREEGADSRGATIKTMKQIQGPIVSTTLVLFALFGPVAFVGGLVGEFFRQFAISILAAVSVSALSALTLSPALCALFLHAPTASPWSPAHWTGLGMALMRRGYVAVSTNIARVSLVAGVAVALFGIAAVWLVQTMPKGFVPQEDQGFFFVNVQLPGGSALVQTERVLQNAMTTLEAIPGITTIVSGAGVDILSGVPAPNTGVLAVNLEPYDQRRTPELSMTAVLDEASRRLSLIPDATMTAFQTPTIQALGNAAGFDFRLQAEQGQSAAELASVLNSLLVTANANPSIANAFSNFSAQTAQIFVDVDRDRASLYGISVSDIYQTLQDYFGSTFVDYFTRENRIFEVNVQLDSQFRETRDEFNRLFVSSEVNNRTIPLPDVISLEDRIGADVIFRYNLFPSAPITGQAAPGASVGDAMAAMAATADRTLPNGYGYEWSTLSYQEATQSRNILLLVAFSSLVGYLLLVALYENWMIPAAVLTSTLVAVFGAAATYTVFGAAGTEDASNRFSNHIYFQISVVLLIGLTSKNAILFVEFAKDLREGGVSRWEAAKQAAHIRFRAITMTTLAFMVGLLPLVLATGPGSASRIAIGAATMGGIGAAMIVGILFVPGLYVLFQGIGDRIAGLASRRSE